MGTAIVVTLLVLLAVGIVVDQLLRLRTWLRRPPSSRHRQVIWECLWRSRCEWTVRRNVVADCVFQAAAAVMIWFQTAKRLVISVRHSGALIR